MLYKILSTRQSHLVIIPSHTSANTETFGDEQSVYSEITCLGVGPLKTEKQRRSSDWIYSLLGDIAHLSIPHPPSLKDHLSQLAKLNRKGPNRHKIDWSVSLWDKNRNHAAFSKLIYFNCSQKSRYGSLIHSSTVSYDALSQAKFGPADRPREFAHAAGFAARLGDAYAF